MTKNREIHSRHLELARLALREDLDEAGDVTSLSMGLSNENVEAYLLVKQKGVLSGTELVRAVLAETDERLSMSTRHDDGDAVSPGAVIAEISGPHRSLLIAERSALNFLQRLSGVATLTAEYVRRVAGTKARIFDTRKTTPTLRDLQKEAVVHGGGQRHRFCLSDQILIKENHIYSLGRQIDGPTEGPKAVETAVLAAKKGRPNGILIQVEVQDVESAVTAAVTGADLILLDNFSIEDLRRAVAHVGDAVETPPPLEASGGIQLENVAEVASTGVQRISVGALTHSAPSLDISLLCGVAP